MNRGRNKSNPMACPKSSALSKNAMGKKGVYGTHPSTSRIPGQKYPAWKAPVAQPPVQHTKGLPSTSVGACINDPGDLVDHKRRDQQDACRNHGMRPSVKALAAAAMMEEAVMMQVRTDGDNDALLVPSGIETVLVGESAHRVIVPEGVEVVQLQGSCKPDVSHDARPNGDVTKSTSPPPSLEAESDSRSSRSRSRSSERTAEPVELTRVRRSAAVDQAPEEDIADGSSRLPAERSLSLPSVPATPPQSADEGPDVSDLFKDTRAQPAVVRHQPVGNGIHLKRMENEAAMIRQPLMANKRRSNISMKFREEFQHEGCEHKRTPMQKLGRGCADVLCCWLGV